jgi:phage repressor protein C with HTH and peptisase S24 domain
MNFKERLEEIRKYFNTENAGLEKILELSNGYISNIEKEGTNNPGKLLVELNKKGISADWFLTGEGEMLISTVPAKPETSGGYKIPLLNQRVSCGEGANWEDEQNIESYIEVFSMIPQHKLGRLFALSVQGNSMIGAGIKSGDYVLFCTGDDPVLDDDIYVFSLDGEVFCKLLEFDIISKKIKIYSIRVADLEKAELLTTLNVEDTDFADRFHIYGRVFCWLHPNFGDE